MTKNIVGRFYTPCFQATGPKKTKPRFVWSTCLNILRLWDIWFCCTVSMSHKTGITLKENVTMNVNAIFCTFLCHMPCLKKTKPRFSWPTRARFYVGWEEYMPRLHSAVPHVPQPADPRDDLPQSEAADLGSTPAHGQVGPIRVREFLHKSAKTTGGPAPSSGDPFPLPSPRLWRLHLVWSGHPVAWWSTSCNSWHNPVLLYTRKTWKLYHLIRWKAPVVQELVPQEISCGICIPS